MISLLRTIKKEIIILSMKKIIANTSILLTLLFLLSCETKPERIIIGEEYKCKSPTDAIVKFKNLDEDKTASTILDYIKSTSISLNSWEKSEVTLWCKNIVFSKYRGYDGIKEWNINDDDFCFTQAVKIQSFLDSIPSGRAEIKICNSVLNKDVSGSAYWRYDAENFTISLSYCFHDLNFMDHVGYYEVTEKDGEMVRRAMSTDKKKIQLLCRYLSYIFG
jgi:hypothetical protein